MNKEKYIYSYDSIKTFGGFIIINILDLTFILVLVF